MKIVDGWGCKVRGRKGQGTGRMRHMKDVPRRYYCIINKKLELKTISEMKES